MPFSEKTVEEAFARSGGQCECRRAFCPHESAPQSAQCRKKLRLEDRGKTWEPHHIHAQAKDGIDSLSNCQILCGPATKKGTCHYFVHN
jgi:hypothetical protein